MSAESQVGRNLLARIRVLVYTHAFGPRIGGVETVVTSLARGLAESGEIDAPARPQVTVVTPTPRGDFDDASLPFRVVRQPSLLRLARLIREADILHIAGPALLPIVLGLVQRRKVVVEHHGFQTICPNGLLLYEPAQAPCPGHFMAGNYGKCIGCNARSGLLNSLKMWLLTFPRRWLCTRVTANITPTNWLSGMLQLPRSSTVHHGVVSDGIGSSEPSAAVRSTFAFVGRLVSTKGVATLLQAAKILQSQGFRFRMIICGDGPERRNLEEQASNLRIADIVQFPGHVPAEKIDAVLGQAATIVVPSLAGEVFGMVAAENMARGKLVIVSDVGAMREVIGETGLWFNPGDVDSLTTQMKRVLMEPDLPVKLGAEARKRASEQFAQDKMVFNHLQIYREAATCAT